MAGTVVDEEAIIKRDQWRELIAAHERSGLSVRVAQRHLPALGGGSARQSTRKS
jgi:hypothetical protein